MKILKAVCHLGVDRMLKAALGDDLSFIRPRNKDGSYKDLTYWVGDLGFPVLEDAPKRGWDIIIIDDIPTAELLKDYESKHKVWYIHGTYHTWGQFQDYANRLFTKMHVLYPDSSRKRYINGWYKHQALSELILPIHPTDNYFVPTPEHRNGRCYVMGNNFLPAANLYGGMDVVSEVLQRLQEFNFDMYGFNDPPPVPAQFVKGSAGSIRDTVKDYSVSVHPSHVETLSFVLLESLAAGVPVITTPKVNLPMSFSEYAYVIANTADEFIHWTKKLVEDEALSLEMGRRGQEFLRSHFQFRDYVSKINYWMKRICNS